jgi:predicted protein tyrosine phosphatase
MDDLPDEVYAVAISAMAANKTIIHLCTLLARKGLLDTHDVEALRHLHLRMLDIGIEVEGTPECARRTIEDVHAILEKAWEAPARALPDGDPPMRR